MTYIIMTIILLALFAITMYGIQYEFNRDFFTIKDTTVLKGIFCIIVLLVHVPALYQNKIQDMVGSFAYIGVTFFFMASAYGLQYGINNKKNYLKSFWKNRLPKLLIPQFIINCMIVIIRICDKGFYSELILDIIDINKWVALLLVFYIIFYIVNILFTKFKRKDIIIIVIVICYSLIDKLFPIKITLGWGVESLGFAYGIVLYNMIASYKCWINKRYYGKSIVLILIGLLLGLIYLKMKPVFFVGDYCVKAILGISLLMIVLQVIGRFRLGNKVSIFLGKISYEVYLSHNVSFMLLNLIIKKSNNLFSPGGGYTFY